MEHQSKAAVHRGGLSAAPRQRTGQYRGRPVHPRRRAHCPRLRDRVTGYITPDWQAVLGYAYTDARISNDLTAPGVALLIVAGNRVQLVPYNQVSLWNKYQIDPTWAAALGVIYFSDSFASSDDSVRLPGFVRFDAAVYAKIDEMWRVQLNVENLFNKGYWATADGNNNISPGQPPHLPPGRDREVLGVGNAPGGGRVPMSTMR